MFPKARRRRLPRCPSMDEQNLSRYTMMSLRKGEKVGHGDAYLRSQHPAGWRQENYEFKVSLRFLARPVSKTRQNNTHHRQTDAHTRIPTRYNMNNL